MLNILTKDCKNEIFFVDIIKAFYYLLIYHIFCVNQVSAQQSEMDGKFTEMRRTVQLLKKYGQRLPDKTQQLFTAAPGRWNNLKTKVSLAKQRLGPRIQEESVSITQVSLPG
jgi:hypothetical protein